MKILAPPPNRQKTPRAVAAPAAVLRENGMG